MMDLSSVSGTAGAQDGTAIGIAVLKKVLDIETQAAMQLIQSLPQPTPASNPPNLGQNLDAFV